MVFILEFLSTFKNTKKIYFLNIKTKKICFIKLDFKNKFKLKLAILIILLENKIKSYKQTKKQTISNEMRLTPYGPNILD